MGEDAEFWKEIREEGKIRRAENRSNNTDLILEACEEMGIKIKAINPYLFRMTKANCRTIDYFPTSSKFAIVGSNKFIRIQPKKIREYLKGYYDQPENKI